MATMMCSAHRLFDGTGAATMTRPVVYIDGDRIESISSDAQAVARVEHRAFPYCTILPGLIDTHVHLVFCAAETNEAVIEQVARESNEELLARALGNARAALYAGVTTVRDCGGKGRIVQQVRGAIRRGEAEGADVLSCGMPITTTRGHCHWLGLVADTYDEVGRAARRVLDEGADFLKVMATGGNMTPSSDPMKAQYDDGILRLIADIGRAAGRHSAAHVLSRAALPGVVAARYRTVEHCDWRIEENTYEFDAELARRLRDQEQYVGLTMSGTTRRAFIPQIAASTAGPVRRLDARFACERRMIDAGVRYTLHSDAGVRWTPIERFALGLRTAVLELRLTPEEAIVAATRTAAEAIGQTDRGTLVPGKRADLVVVEGNPLTDIACLERVRAVMKAGRWIDLPPPSEAV
jgi:imidazolonepropionase-like amidohydrolase